MEKPKKTTRVSVRFIDSDDVYTFTLASETDWGVVCDGAMVEIKDMSGLKAYFPTGLIAMEIV